MDWFKRLWERVAGEDQVDMMLVRDVDGSQDAGPGFVTDECYVELFVNSLRLHKARRFATKFDGVVYSYVTLAYGGENSVTVPAISKPAKLVQLDPGGLGAVITVDKQMMGAMPWRGGNLQLELGLFSVKGDSLLTPVLDFVTEISSAAGVSFIGTIKPFAPLIAKGMDMIAGQTSSVALEVGLDSSALNRPGTHAIIAVPKDGSIDTRTIRLDPTDRKLLVNGAPLVAAYCVFTLQRVEIKADFGDIPELKERYTALRAAVRTGQSENADAALKAFRLVALTSPDLIRKDAQRLVKLADEMVKEALGQGLVSLESVAVDGTETLADLKLYP